jgi:Zn finger protein HypA/HybF involved in hydrogenase expression
LQPVQLVELKCRRCGEAFKAVDPNKQLCGRCTLIQKRYIQCPFCERWWKPKKYGQACPYCGVFACFVIYVKDEEEKG